jgi:hypothetical protein
VKTNNPSRAQYQGGQRVIPLERTDIIRVIESLLDNPNKDYTNQTQTDVAFPRIRQLRSYIKLRYNFRKQACTVTVKSVELVPTADRERVAYLLAKFNLNPEDFLHGPNNHAMNIDDDKHVDLNRFQVNHYIAYDDEEWIIQHVDIYNNRVTMSNAEETEITIEVPLDDPGFN